MRLRVVGLDLRMPSGVEEFASWLSSEGTPHLDIIINNACQTIRRPASYYAHLLPGEEAGHRAMLLEQEKDDARGRAAQGGAEDGIFLPEEHEKQWQHAATDGSSLEHRETRSNLGGGGTQRSILEASRVLSPSSLTAPCGSDVGLVGGMMTAAAMSVVEVTDEDRVLGADCKAREAALPTGALDAHGQQLDTRRVNSWLLNIDQVRDATPQR